MADLEAVRANAEPVLAGLGLELVDVEVVGSGRARTLRVSIDRPEGVDLDALAAASRPLSRSLEEADVLSGPYNLEVSSPGLERPLRRPSDFRRFVGTTISLKSHEPVSDARRHRGLLVEADDDVVVLEVEGERRCFPYPGIAGARTVFEWGPAPKPGRRGKPARSKTAAGARGEERLT